MVLHGAVLVVGHGAVLMVLHGVRWRVVHRGMRRRTVRLAMVLLLLVRRRVAVLHVLAMVLSLAGGLYK